MSNLEIIVNVDGKPVTLGLKSNSKIEDLYNQLKIKNVAVTKNYKLIVGRKFYNIGDVFSKTLSELQITEDTNITLVVDHNLGDNRIEIFQREISFSRFFKNQ